MTLRISTSLRRQHPVRVPLTLVAVAALIQSFPLIMFAQHLPQPLSLRLGYSRLRISLPIFVALQKGYFAAEDIKASLTGFDTAQPMMSDLVTGHLDAAGYCAFPITFSAQVTTRTRLQYLTLLYEDDKHPISILIVSPSGTRISKLSDLKGRNIGILPTIAYRVWLIQAMQAAGIDKSQFAIIPIDPILSGTALKSGQIQALFSNDPAITAAIRSSGAVDFLHGSLCARYIQNPFPFGSFNVDSSFAASHPDATTRIARALDRAIAFIRANPAESKRLMRPYIVATFQQDVDRYPDSAYRDTTDITFSDEFLQNIASQYKNSGIIKKIPDLVNSTFHRH